MPKLRPAEMKAQDAVIATLKKDLTDAQTAKTTGLAPGITEKDNLDKAQTDFDKAKKDKTELKAKVGAGGELDNKLKKAETKLDDAKKKKTELEAKISTSGDLHDALDAAQQAFDKAKNDKTDLAATVKTDGSGNLYNELKKAQDDFNNEQSATPSSDRLKEGGDLHDALKAAEEKVNTAKAEITRLEDKITGDLKTTLDAAQKDFDDAIAEIRSLDGEIKGTLQTNLDAAQKDFDDAKAEITRLETEITGALKTALDTAQNAYNAEEIKLDLGITTAEQALAPAEQKLKYIVWACAAQEAMKAVLADPDFAALKINPGQANAIDVDQIVAEIEAQIRATPGLDPNDFTTIVNAVFAKFHDYVYYNPTDNPEYDALFLRALDEIASGISFNYDPA